MKKKMHVANRKEQKTQWIESNSLKLDNVKEVCSNAYSQGSNASLSVADSVCKEAINDLSYANKNRFCLNTKKELEEVLRSEPVSEEIVEHAIHMLKRFCDANAMTRVQSICARRSLDIMTELLDEKKRAGNRRRCKNAINSLSNENKQNFCSANKGKNSLKVIKRICDAFINDINAATNYRCIAPYLDAMWYDASEEDLKEIDSNCKAAISQLHGENKEKFCKEYKKTIPERGSLLINEGTIDDNIRNRAINVVEGACSGFFHSRDKREISKIMKEIKMENAENGISEALISSTLPSIVALPKNNSGGINTTQGLLAPSRNEMGTFEQNNKGLFIVIGVMGAFISVFSAYKVWCTIKDCKNAGSDLENQPTENQRLLNP